MPPNACPIYLDPWVKAELEGYALAVQRIPDIPESTHHGVTCQRWHVRFQEDQENAVRWLDAGDFYPWAPADRNSSIFQLSLPSANLSNEATYLYLFQGDVHTAASGPALLMPTPGRIRAIATYHYATARTGDPAKLKLHIYKNGAFWFTWVLADSLSSGEHLYNFTDAISNRNFNAGDYITAVLVGSSGNGDWTIDVINLLFNMRIQWGTFP